MINEARDSRKDWASRPGTMILWWGLPIAIGASTVPMHLSFQAKAAICAISFVWMGTGCLLNARRCHRVHCYISGPVLLLGATFAGLVASGIVNLDQHTLQQRGQRDIGARVAFIRARDCLETLHLTVSGNSGDMYGRPPGCKGFD
jgi:hypothetical protein